jgi:hypothetical protein
MGRQPSFLEIKIIPDALKGIWNNTIKFYALMQP